MKIQGRDPDEADISLMVKDFIPTQEASLPKYSTLLPGSVEAVNVLRKDLNMKLGCTTAYSSTMVKILIREAKKQGLELDAAVARDDVLHGSKPRPFMLYKNLDLLDVWPIQAVVKVDDLASGIGEAIQAGCWGVGVARYSRNMKIHSLEDEAKLSKEEIEKKLEASRDILWKAGAHYVIDTVAELPEVCREINARMKNGEAP